MDLLGKYFSIYKEFVSTCIAEATSFRVNFILLIIMDLIYYALTIATINIIFNHIEKIGPWGKNEFLFFFAFMIAVDHLHMTFASENFWDFPEFVRMGTLDFLLLKPVAPLFMLFFRRVRPSSFLNIFFTVGLLIYCGLKIQLSIWAWVCLPFFVFLSFLLFVSIDILLMMSVFYVVEGTGVNFLRMQFQTVGKWPDFIYKSMFRKLFLFAFPILMIASAPSRFLINYEDWILVAIFPITLMVVWGLIGLCWRRGIRHYESASS